VWVIDQSSTQNVCCTLTSTNPLGNPGELEPAGCTSGQSASCRLLARRYGPADVRDTDTAPPVGPVSRIADAGRDRIERQRLHGRRTARRAHCGLEIAGLPSGFVDVSVQHTFCVLL